MFVGANIRTYPQMSKLNIHFISIGGALMHNLALELAHIGHTVTGSDDEIYEPARARLEKAGLLPESVGWFSEKIHPKLDFVLLGMHARADNPELLAAQAAGVRVFSYPEYLYEHAKHKIRVVVAGSHGKTTTTSLIMSILKQANASYDYAVGAAISGFERMVKLSDAPVMVIEGDEYLSSPIDKRSKFLHYRPHIGILTGISYDHMNVFPTFESYTQTFADFLDTFEPKGQLFAYAGDPEIDKLLTSEKILAKITEKGLQIVRYQAFIPPTNFGLKLFGKHNFENIQAAILASATILSAPLEKVAEYLSLSGFSGAAKRLEKLYDSPKLTIFRDFAHAPSKVAATVAAVEEEYPQHLLIAGLELHTFSSLNRDFLPYYAQSMQKAGQGFVCMDTETFHKKKLPVLTADFVREAFQKNDLLVHTHPAQSVEFVQKSLEATQNAHESRPIVLLLMSSGDWGGLSGDFIPK